MNNNILNLNKRYHRTGRIWMFFAILLMLSVPVICGITMHASVNWKAFFQFNVFWVLVGLYLPTGIGEIFLYSNMLGTNGMYLAFVTGNLSNLKVPCVINAREFAKTEIGTEENEIVSTIAIAVSSIVTVLIIAIGVILLSVSGVSEFLQSDKAKFLEPAFGSVAFALFGALGGKYLIKYPRVAIIPFVIITAVCIILVCVGQGKFASTGNMIFVGVIFCYLNARRLYYKKCKAEQKEEVKNLLNSETNKNDAEIHKSNSDNTKTNNLNR